MSSGSTSGLFSSSATITGSSVSVPVLSKSRLIGSLRQVLREVGVASSRSSGHSFRIRAATAAAKLGVSNSMIKVLGRWLKSSAFTCYMRMPWKQLAQRSGLLSGGDSVDSTGRILNVTCHGVFVPLVGIIVYHCLNVTRG